MLLVCVDCLFPLHDVKTPTEKKDMGGQRITLSLAQPRWHRRSASSGCWLEKFKLWPQVL